IVILAKKINFFKITMAVARKVEMSFFFHSHPASLSTSYYIPLLESVHHKAVILQKDKTDTHSHRETHPNEPLSHSSSLLLLQKYIVFQPEVLFHKISYHHPDNRVHWQYIVFLIPPVFPSPLQALMHHIRESFLKRFNISGNYRQNNRQSPCLSALKC
ncbi:MAG: hypothetical protein K2O34_05090, partial [Acetatifactor sp.]|nr:hypothetical protein [Acetatifactor sp.]